MKNYVILAVLSLLSLHTVIGQDFGAVGSEWYYTYYSKSWIADTEYKHTESVSDTTILGKTANKLVQKLHDFNGTVVTINTFFVYEESDTVYMYNSAKNRFLQFLIFNGSQGDTLTLHMPDAVGNPPDSVYQLIIDTVTTEVFDGIPLKRFETTPIDLNNGYFPSSFMEKIGGLNGFLPIFGPQTLGGIGDGGIRCYHDTQVDTNFRSFPCDFRYPNSIDELSQEVSLDVFPNPTSDQLTVRSSEAVSQLVLRNLLGQTVNTSANNAMDLTNAPDGIYLLEVSLQSGEQTSRKVIKRTF